MYQHILLFSFSNSDNSFERLSYSNFSLKVRILPGLVDLAQGKISVSKLKEVDISDLLGRYEVEANSSLINKNIENRLGLQKIDFGSALLIRPLQWFNQIDPRDPLRLTNGVYGILFRQYFNDNSNIWLWNWIPASFHKTFYFLWRRISRF